MKGPENNIRISSADQREKIPYSERSILVLGGSSGIGLMAVSEFARLGAANIFVGTRSLDNFSKAKAYLARRQKLDVDSLPIHPFHADITDKKQIVQASQEIKQKGKEVTDVIFSQAAGMESYIQRLLADYLDPITKHTFNTPIYELPEDKRRIVEEKLDSMRSALAQWTQDAIPHAIAVNYQGTFDAIDVLGETFPNGFTGVFYNSTWGKLSGTPGIEIPLMYRPVDHSKAMVRDRLQQEGNQLVRQGIHMAEIVASLVNATKVLSNWYGQDSIACHKLRIYQDGTAESEFIVGQNLCGPDSRPPMFDRLRLRNGVFTTRTSPEDAKEHFIEPVGI